MEQHLSQYRIFYEVAKAGNISKAAKELFISQPAISKAISKLEDNLDVTLFTTKLPRRAADQLKGSFSSSIRGERLRGSGPRASSELKRIREFQHRPA